jgi:hypothetical protein
MALDPNSFGGAVVFIIMAAFVGAFATWIITFLGNRRGNRVIITRISETPQIVISPDVKPDLEIKYKNTLVKKMVVNSVTISNRGKSVIEPLLVELKISPVDEELNFLEVSRPKDPLEKTKVEIKERTLVIFRDFLNSQNRYKEEELTLSILSNCRLKFEVVGGGKDWHAKFLDYKGPINTRKVIFKMLLVLLYTVGIFFVEIYGEKFEFSPIVEYTIDIIAFVSWVGIVVFLFRDLNKN